MVILVDGDLVLYVERGGRTLLTFTDNPDRLARAADDLALAARDGAPVPLAVEKGPTRDRVRQPPGRALTEAGSAPTAPRPPPPEVGASDAGGGHQSTWPQPACTPPLAGQRLVAPNFRVPREASRIEQKGQVG